jgi:acid stress-induced BolA-like protein IbaG/YrbA
MEEEENGEQATEQVRAGVIQILKQFDQESDLDRMQIIYAGLVAVIEFMEEEDVEFTSEIDL